MGASNDFYNFVIDSYSVFKKQDGTSLKSAWAMYNTYCEEAKVPYPYSQRNFKEELKNYFREFEEREEGDSRIKNFYRGFKTDIFKSEKNLEVKNGENKIETGLKKFGCMIGDMVEVGCGSVLNPGSVIGNNSNIYPLSSVRGVVPSNSIYKKQGEIAIKHD